MVEFPSEESTNSNPERSWSSQWFTDDWSSQKMHLHPCIQHKTRTSSQSDKVISEDPNVKMDILRTPSDSNNRALAACWVM